MKIKLVISILFLGFAVLNAANQKNILQLIDETLKHSVEQTISLYEEISQVPDRLPRTINQAGKLVTSNDGWWTSGFFPGTLWYLYEYAQTDDLKRAAQVMTHRVEKQQYTTDNHDVGFMIFCSYGNGYRLINEKSYEQVIVNAAKSLATRFNPVTGTIKSWDNRHWQYPVIIDNMMNLELLTQATNISGESSFYKIAVAHADTTLKYHFRADGSSYHVVSYDTIQGGFTERVTHQGAHDESAWARGQAWGLYGFVMMYRETGKPEYLSHAIKIADYIINHPNLPKDGIPYWDFNAPNIPNELRDASAGAVIASALIELSTFTNKKISKKYLASAEKMVVSLSNSPYLAKKGENGNFILKHSVGFLAKNSEVDAPLTYADYYFLEALLRYKRLVYEKRK